jgi:hypothetical protein
MAMTLHQNIFQKEIHESGSRAEASSTLLTRGPINQQAVSQNAYCAKRRFVGTPIDRGGRISYDIADGHESESSQFSVATLANNVK